MKSQPNGANPKQLSISNLINQTQENQNNKVLLKKKGSLASKVAKFQQNQSNLAIPISIKQPQSYPWSQSNHQTQNFKDTLRNNKINSIVQKASPNKQPKSKNHFKFQFWPQVKISNSNPKLASISKSDPKPMVPNQHKDFKPQYE